MLEALTNNIKCNTKLPTNLKQSDSSSDKNEKKKKVGLIMYKQQDHKQKIMFKGSEVHPNPPK